MYEHLRGTLDDASPVHAVVDVGGVGYVLSIPLSTFERLPARGCAVRLLTALVVREDAHRLFGFGTEAERRFFRVLLGVSGVGPAVALGVVSTMPFAAFAAAVAAGDAAQLRRVKGVGKRLSERLVVELRDLLAGEPVAPGSAPAMDGAAQDALLALEALGFARATAQKAVAKAMQEIGDSGTGEPGDLVRLALRHT